MSEPCSAEATGRIRWDAAWAVVTRIGADRNVLLSNNGSPAVFNDERTAEWFARDHFGSRVVPARCQVTLLAAKETP